MVDEQQPSPEMNETPSEPAEQDLGRLLEDARGKADEHWEQLLRVRAELDNLRRRNQRELENAHKYALERFAQELLPVRDSLEMGLAAANGESPDIAKLREGTELTLKMLGDVMGRFGISEVDPLHQPFNPELHQAMATQESAELEPNRVLVVYQKGYLLNDRLIRPAMVVVSKAPAAAPEAGGSEPGGNIDAHA